MYTFDCRAPPCYHPLGIDASGAGAYKEATVSDADLPLSYRLRAKLPAHLHHHVETLGNYLEAAKALQALMDAPENGAEVKEALQQLKGEEFPIKNGVVTFAANTQTGDVRLRDTAGRDIIKIVINADRGGVGVASRQGFRPDQSQLLILRAIAKTPDNRTTPTTDEAIAKATGIPQDEVQDDLDILEANGFVELARSSDSYDVLLTALGRKFLRNYVQDRLAEVGLKPLHLDILRLLARNGGESNRPVTYDTIYSELNITPRQLQEHIPQLKDGSFIRTLAQALGIQVQGRVLLAEFDSE